MAPPFRAFVFFTSMTKTFTAVLLGDMWNAVEMKLDDPGQNIFRIGRVPARNGREPSPCLIIVTHTAGFPRDPDNLTP